MTDYIPGKGSSHAISTDLRPICRSSYTFGYLFALGVYAHGESAGDGFHAQYVALLRDTGRMTAEELVQQHLGVSIEDKSFWARSTAIVERKLDVFEASLGELGL